MNEECIIRKLIADGDGGGDDRRFASLLPLIIRMIKDPESTSRYFMIFLNSIIFILFI